MVYIDTRTKSNDQERKQSCNHEFQVSYFRYTVKTWATELFETSVALEGVQLGCLFHTEQEADH